MAFPPKKSATDKPPFPMKKKGKTAGKGDPKLSAALQGLKKGMGPVGPPDDQGM